MIEKLTINIKKLPVVSRVLLGLEAVACIISVLSAIKILSVMNTIAYIYLYSEDGSLPSKGVVFLTIISAIILLAAIYLLVSTPTEKNVKIYFIAVGVNLAMQLIMNGFTIIGFVGGLILPGVLGYLYYNDKSILGVEDPNMKM